MSRPRRASLLAAALLPLALLFILTGFMAESAAQEVTAEVDKSTATLEDQIVLTVSVSGNRRFEGEPRLPPLPDFEVAAGGTSSRTEIVNGRFNSSLEYTFLLTPKREGTFTIGPVTVQSRGNTYQSQPLQVRILTAQTGDGESPSVFITQEVDITTPYVRQQIVYTFRFFQKTQAVDVQWQAPDFQGFWVEDLGKERHYQSVRDGETFAVTEIKKALFPTTEGTLEIPETQIICKVLSTGRRQPGSRGIFDDDFFSSPLFGRGAQAVNKTLRAKPIRLEVKPLPVEGRPLGFQGLVGVFELEAKVGDQHLRSGDSTTLTVSVSGQGNLRDLVSIPPEEIAGFKVYPDKPSFELTTQGDSVRNSRVFKKALVPLEPGSLQVPALQLTYFDPQAGAYRVAQTAPIPMVVAKGEQTETLHLVQSPAGPGAQTSIRILGRDILPIHTGLAGADRQLPRGSGLVVYLSALLSPPIAFFAVYGVKRRRDRLEGAPHLARKREARKKANRELKEAKKLVSRGEDREFYRQLARSVKGLVGDKLNLSALAFTPVEIRHCLEEKGFREDAVRSVFEFLEKLEFCQYASGRADPAERDALHRKAKEMLAFLDKQL